MGVTAAMETGSVTLWHSLLLLLLLWSSLSSSQSSLVLWTYFPVCTHERCSITGLEHSPHHRGTNWGRKAKRRHWLDRHWGDKKCLWIVVTFYCEQKQWLVVQVKNTLFLYHKTNSSKCFRMNDTQGRGDFHLSLRSFSVSQNTIYLCTEDWFSLSKFCSLTKPTWHSNS